MAADVIYLDVSEKNDGQITLPVGPGVNITGDADVKLKGWIVTPSVRYSLIENEKGSLNLLVGAHRRRAGAIGKQPELLFLNAILHVAARAIELFIESLRVGLACSQVGDDKAWIGLARQVFRLANDAPLARPGLARLIVEVAEAPRRLTSAFMGDAGFFDLFAQRTLQALVARQPQHVAHVMGFAPSHDRLAAEPGIATDHDTRLRPTGADLDNDPFELVDTAR